MIGTRTSREVAAPNLPLWSFQLRDKSRLALRSRKELEIRLLTRALRDEVFRRELTTSSKSVVERELGAELPEGMEYHVIEETGESINLIIPANPYQELSESRLEQLHGMSLEDVARWVWRQQSRVFLEETMGIEILVRFWRDEAFRRDLLNHTAETMATEFGIPNPEDKEIRVFVEDGRHTYLVLPPAMQSASHSWEVTDDILEEVTAVEIGSCFIDTSHQSVGCCGTSV